MKTQLADLLDQAAKWRTDDAKRAQADADGLRAAAEYARNLPDDDDRLTTLTALNLDDSDLFDVVFNEEAARLIKGYRFDVPSEPPDRWLNRFTDDVSRAARNNAGLMAWGKREPGY
ncbi:hypothetical protein BH20ACT9_BH20ACT9_06040 [soil metagenome]